MTHSTCCRCHSSIPGRQLGRAPTLSESSLYTREAWQTFLDRLKPAGVLSVSRWFQPDRVSETSRLLALGIASLLDRGVAEPDQHLILVSRRKVANLLVSPSPDGLPPATPGVGA